MGLWGGVRVPILPHLQEEYFVLVHWVFFSCFLWRGWKGPSPSSCAAARSLHHTCTQIQKHCSGPTLFLSATPTLDTPSISSSWHRLAFPSFSCFGSSSLYLLLAVFVLLPSNIPSDLGLWVCRRNGGLTHLTRPGKILSSETKRALQQRKPSSVSRGIIGESVSWKKT